MGDSSVKKVQSKMSPHGSMGQAYLASGIHLSMRLWDHVKAAEQSPETARDYETVGYVISGRAELQLEGQKILLEAGDSWTVPKGARHSYKILEALTAVEATSPPAEIHDRDRV